MQIHENLLTLGKQNRPGEKMIQVRAIAFHWLAAPKQKPINTRAWFESAKAWGSYHYIIGVDGSVMRVIPENEIGWHVGSNRKDPKSGRIYTDRARTLFGPQAFTGRSPTNPNFFITPNYFSIGIGMSHLDNNPGTFTEATLRSAALLAAGIMRRYQLPPQSLTTHHEIVGWKDCPRSWTNNPALFDQFKQQVRQAFMAMR